MKNIEVDEQLYQYIVANTQEIGESASSILRRLLAINGHQVTQLSDSAATSKVAEKALATSDKKEIANTVKTSVFNVINKEELAMQRGAVGRFLIILSALHRVHSQDFHRVCEIRGRDRLYFAKDERALEQSGSSTKPRQIPDSDFWVITNSNTTRKKMMLTEVAKELGYTNEDVEAIRDLL
ncbi:replication initiation negative regulator SeqA [Thalassotalea ganghwensis]